MARRIGRKKWGALKWMTRSVEVLAVLSSLFWAIEANACDKCPYEKKNLRSESTDSSMDRAPAGKELRASTNHSRSPAYVDREPGSTRMSLLFSENSSEVSRHPHRLLPELDELKAPDSVVQGQSLSWSFRQNPYFVPTSLELFRFPSLR